MATQDTWEQARDAISRGDETKLKQLCSANHGLVSFCGDYGYWKSVPLLVYAASIDEVRATRLLLDAGAPILASAAKIRLKGELGSQEDATALHVCKSRDMCAMLLKAGADRTLKTKSGLTPLDFAIQRRRDLSGDNSSKFSQRIDYERALDSTTTSHLDDPLQSPDEIDQADLDSLRAKIQEMEAREKNSKITEASLRARLEEVEKNLTHQLDEQDPQLTEAKLAEKDARLAEKHTELATLAQKCQELRAIVALNGLIPSSPTFSTSNFKQLYETMYQEPIKYTADLIVVVRSLIKAYCDEEGIKVGRCSDYCQKLLEVSFESNPALFKNIDLAIQRLWTSGEKLERREFCFIINSAIRKDSEPMISPAVQIARNISQLNSDLRNVAASFTYPPAGQCFRGTSIPGKHQSFYEPGKRFRVPGFFATSFSVETAKRFLPDMDSEYPAVLFYIQLHPRGAKEFAFRCKHAHLVDNSVFDCEDEFLFAPYSIFTVRLFQRGDGNNLNPHIIHLDAAFDNRLEPYSEYLPLAPWY